MLQRRTNEFGIYTFFSSPLTNRVFCVSIKGPRVNTASNLVKWYCYIAKFMLRILMTPNRFSNNSIYYHFDKIAQLEWMELLGLFGNRFDGLASSMLCPQQSILQIRSEGIFGTGETMAYLREQSRKKEQRMDDPGKKFSGRNTKNKASSFLSSTVQPISEFDLRPMNSNVETLDFTTPLRFRNVCISENPKQALFTVCYSAIPVNWLMFHLQWWPLCLSLPFLVLAPTRAVPATLVPSSSSGPLALATPGTFPSDKAHTLSLLPMGSCSNFASADSSLWNSIPCSPPFFMIPHYLSSLTRYKLHEGRDFTCFVY